MPTKLERRQGNNSKKRYHYYRANQLQAIVQALAPQGDVVALFHAFFFRRELLALSSCLHDSAAATRIPAVASPTDGYAYGITKTIITVLSIFVNLFLLFNL